MTLHLKKLPGRRCACCAILQPFQPCERTLRRSGVSSAPREPPNVLQTRLPRSSPTRLATLLDPLLSSIGSLAVAPKGNGTDGPCLQAFSPVQPVAGDFDAAAVRGFCPGCCEGDVSCGALRCSRYPGSRRPVTLRDCQSGFSRYAGFQRGARGTPPQFER